MYSLRIRKRNQIVRLRLFHRSISHFSVTEHVLPASHIRTYPGAIKEHGQAQLKLALKQYVPLRTQHDALLTLDAVTIIGGHANGFPKELYEPLWDELYERLISNGKTIRSIWIADIVNQGQSGLINQDVLGNDPNWWDHARDLLFAINQKQTEMPQPLIGVGHSMGACILTGLSMLHPSLFQSLVLIEPVMQIEIAGKAFAPPSTYRRDRWPSKKAAVEGFMKSKFYQSWDSRVLDKWFEHGLTPDKTPPSTTALNNQTPSPTATTKESISKEVASHNHHLSGSTSSQTEPAAEGEKGVKLTTPKPQELYHYIRPLYKSPHASPSLKQKLYPDINPTDLEKDYDFYRPESAELFRKLPELRPGVKYIFGEMSAVSTPELRREKLERTGVGVGGSGGVVADRVEESVLVGMGHMLPFERPGECADVAARWIALELERWEKLEIEWRKLRGKDANGEWGNDVDGEWLRRMPRPERSRS